MSIHKKVHNNLTEWIHRDSGYSYLLGPPPNSRVARLRQLGVEEGVEDMNCFGTPILQATLLYHVEVKIDHLYQQKVMEHVL